VVGSQDRAFCQRFELGYVTADGERHRKVLSQCWNVRFEGVPPVRAFVSYKGQKNFTGLRWTATVDGHVGFESWLERDNLMLLDFDPAVTGISSQPFVMRVIQASLSKCRPTTAEMVSGNVSIGRR
jgi:hypothetical protein